MLFTYSQFAVYGGGSGNASELHVTSLAHLTTAFFIA